MVGFLSPIYNLIYRATYDLYLGFVYGLSCTILSIMFCFTMYVNLYIKKYEKRQRLKEKYELEKLDVATNSNDTADPTSPSRLLSCSKPSADEVII